MKVAVIAIVLFLSMASCSNIAGKAINDFTFVGGPAVYIDGPNRVDITQADPDGLFQTQVFITGHNNITGYEYAFQFVGTGLSLSQVQYSKVFGNVQDTDYYCFNHTLSGNTIEELACTGITDGANFPAFNQYAYLHNITLLATQAGIATLSLPMIQSIKLSDGSIVTTNAIVADSNGEPLLLQDTGSISRNPGYLEVLICEDRDGDNFFTTDVCAAGTDPVDCNDADSAINPNAQDICDTVDNNCINGIIEEDASECQAYYPEIIRVETGGQAEIYPTPPSAPQVQGDLSLTIEVQDNSTETSPWGGSNSVEKVVATLGADSYEVISPFQNSYTITGIDTTKVSDGINTITIQVYDTQNLGDGTDMISEVTVDVDVKNDVDCDVQSVSWVPSSVNEADFSNLTVTGNSNCKGATLDISYTECDGGICNSDIPANALFRLPVRVELNNLEPPTGKESTGQLLWFDDSPDGDGNPEIKATVQDDVGGQESNLLTISNLPPEVSATATPDVGSATVDVSANELSTFQIRYGTAPGNYNTGLQDSPSDILSHTFTLDNLAEVPTTYYYVVTATDVAGLPTTTQESNFSTQAYPADIANGSNGQLGPDGSVDIFDLLYAVQYFRFTKAEDPTRWANEIEPADVRKDDIINILDLTNIVIRFS